MPGARGETTLQIGSREIRLLFTNRAIAEAEGQIGKSIIAIAQGFVSGDSALSMNELVQLLRVGMEAARRDSRESGRPITVNEAFDVIDQIGFAKTAQAVFGGIGAVLSYGGEDNESPNL